MDDAQDDESMPGGGAFKRSDLRVLPAEVGWRAVLTNGEKTYLVRVVGWAVETRVWGAERGRTADEVDVYGEPLIPSARGTSITRASEVVAALSDSAGAWRFDGLLAPGENLDDVETGGWRPVVDTRVRAAVEPEAFAAPLAAATSS